MYGCMDVCIYVCMYEGYIKMNNNVTHSNAMQRNLTDAWMYAWMHACIPVYACLHVKNRAEAAAR